VKLTTMTALAEANRLRIVELLRDGPLTVNEIANRLALGQPQTSKHLRVLHECGVVDVHPRANKRYYALRFEAFRELDAWLAPFRRVWEERMNNLDEYLRILQSEHRDGHTGDPQDMDQPT